jgi:hypothetical protein
LDPLARGQAKPQPAQLLWAPFLEGLQEDSADGVLVVTVVRVVDSQVRRTVVDAADIRNGAAQEIAVELHTDISARHQVRRQPTLDEEDVLGRLPPLEADWRLLLPGP